VGDENSRRRSASAPQIAGVYLAQAAHGRKKKIRAWKLSGCRS
jgi:hypothetical protein